MSKLNDKPMRAQSNAAPYSLINEQLPLNAVRAFTEAAKHCNFSKAAASLGMTQSGVSRHVANLEQWTQQQLFIRNGGQLTLTDAGRLYHESIREAMATIDLVSRQLKTQGAKTRLPTLAVRTSLPTFSMSVLIPALSTFQAEHQTNIEVLTALSPLEPMDKCDVLITRDLIIQDAEQWHLFSEDLICVGSAKILSECKNIPPSKWPYLAPRSRPDLLIRWSSALGIDATEIKIANGYDHLFLAISAALSGVGVLVVPSILVADHLTQGTLCKFEAGHIRGNSSYVAYVHPASNQIHLARFFCRWLKAVLAQKH
jgi:LysR family glycine cleavage system transcriptional activator